MKNSNTETVKVINDYIKHLNTLSTGSILLLVTFLEKLFLRPSGKWLVGIALICFLLSVIGGIVAKTVTTLRVGEETEFQEGVVPYFDIPLFSYGLVFLWAGFLLGILFLAIFGVINIF